MNGITEIYRVHLDVDNVVCYKRVCDLETQSRSVWSEDLIG